jgi:hypothetical protein
MNMMQANSNRSLKSNHTSAVTKLVRRSVLANILEVRLFILLTAVDLLVNEPGLHYKEEIIFDDGTVYKG